MVLNGIMLLMFVPRTILLIDFTQYSHSTYLLDIMHKAFSGANYIPLVERSVMFRVKVIDEEEEV